jgi:prevent-host-death family protein
MATVTLEEAQARLPELIQQVADGADVLITRGEQPLARLVPVAAGGARPQFGSCKGMLTIVSDDEEHLKDFTEYMP